MFVPRLAPSVLAVLLATGCAATTAAEGPTAPPPSSVPAAASSFGGTDLAWIQINIAMNEEIVPLLDLAAAHSFDEGTKALATLVRRSCDEELATLRRLHDEAGLPAENPHKGMPMPGLVTPEIVAAAARAEGPAYDRLLRTHLKAHLEQGLQLARSEAKSGREPRSKALAATMIEHREAFLSKIPGTPK